MMKRQKIRKTLLLLSLLLIPVTLYYLSPYLIIQAGFAGIVAGSVLFFAALFLFSLFFGRAFCGWLCPAGALQDSCAQISGKKVGRKQRYIKYFIWVPWIIAIVAGFISAGGIKSLEPLYFTAGGISVSDSAGYMIYYTIVGAILLVALLFGRRSFCHSLCWMAPFMIIGSRFKNRLGYPSLRLTGDKAKCIQCKQCDKNCPMSLQVSGMVSGGRMKDDECILCGNCADRCPSKAINLKIS